MAFKSPHVCIIVTSDLTAGTFLKGYLDELHARGFQSTVICSPGPGTFAIGKRSRERLLTIPMQRGPAPLADAVSLVRLTLALKKAQPDVVVYATPKASLLGSLAAKFAGVAVRVYELWGLRLETSHGVPRIVYRALEQLTMRLSTSVLANSRSLAQRVQELGLSKVPPSVLGSGSSHGVDLDYFAPHATKPAVDCDTRNFLDRTGGFTIGFIGRLHPDKGVDVIARAMEICAADGLAVRALLVGRDEGAHIGNTASLPIHLTGEVADPRPYLAEIDLLVLMSLREGFPNVVLEAASMGVPAIVSDSTGAIDSVVDGVTGYVIPVDDAAALADRIRHLGGDERTRSQLGAGARARARMRFGKRDVCRMHVDFYVSEWSARAGRPRR